MSGGQDSIAHFFLPQLLVAGYIPILNLILLEEWAHLINSGRPVYPPQLKNTGRALNKGDSAMHSDYVREGYNLDGSGIKIGVISDSYNIPWF